MNTRINWRKATLLAVLALTSLTSLAMSLPHRDQPTVYTTRPEAVPCGETSIDRVERVRAAIEWGEKGGPVPETLSVSCVGNDLNRAVSQAAYGGESWDRFKLYLAAIEGSVPDRALNAAPVCVAYDSQARLDQVRAAIEWGETGGPLPPALSASYCEDNLNRAIPRAAYGGESWDRFKLYLAAIGQ